MSAARHPSSPRPRVRRRSLRRRRGPAARRQCHARISPTSPHAPPRRSEPSHGAGWAAAPRLDDRDFLIEPGTGFSPERRSGEPERRGTKTPPRPPSSPAFETASALPPSTPSAPPPAGSTQANFIAAARRTIQANAMESAEASSNARRSAACSRQCARRSADRGRRAAAAVRDDPAKPADKAEPERRLGGALARASAFFSARKRPLVLGLAGIVVMLCALELVRTEASPPVVVADETGVRLRRAGRHRRASPTQQAMRRSPPAARLPSPPSNRRPPAVPTKLEAPSRRVPRSSHPTSTFRRSDRSRRLAAPSAAPPPTAGPADLMAVRDLAASGNAAAELRIGPALRRGPRPAA